MMQVLDAGARIPGAVVKADGRFGGVIRYVAPYMNGAPNPKCITPAELADDLANGLLVGVVFEQGATNCLGGAAQGHIDGAVARESAKALAFAPGGVIYAAVDYNAPSSDWPTIAAYLDAFRSEVHAGGYRQGGYGRYGLGLQMLEDGHAEAWWESGAWSGDQRLQGHLDADLFQRIGQVTVGGVQCDVNDVWADDWGQWPRPVAAAQIPAPIVSIGSLEENTMRSDVQVPTDGKGNGWEDTNVPWDQYRAVSVQGFDPPFVGGYLNPVVTAHDVNGQTRVVVTGWLPNKAATVHVASATA